ncbi:hypothetical protein LQW54_000841 [Pestalotiopsis sp. IQ-011]
MPSKSEWESQKDVIRELYLNKDYPLKALRDRMNSAGFVATKSQYETKFKAWGFSKNDTNVSAATWKHVGYKIAKRKHRDEDSTVFIDGVEFNHKRVKKEISRYTYSTIERVQLESIGAPSPPGPLAIVATPPSSQQAFSINYWPGNLPWLTFVRALNAHLPSVHQANKIPPTVLHGLFMPQSGPQADLLSRNETSIPDDSQRLAHIATGRERLNLIQTILPHISDPERAPEIQNSMSLLSTTSSHWGLKLLIYLASNNLLEPEDLDDIWRLVEETGIKELANISKSLHLGETSLKAALEYLFEAGVWASRDALVRGVRDLVQDYRKLPRSQKHEAHIIRQVCVERNVYLIGLVLELFPSTYSPAALEELILFQTEQGVNNWKLIEELLQRRLNASSSLDRHLDTRIFMHAVYNALIHKDNSEVLQWFHDNSPEAFELANLNPSAFLMNVIHSPVKLSPRLQQMPVELKSLNMNQLYKNGLKTSAYLGLLAVFTGRVDQISDLLHNGMRPSRRFAWSLTILQLAVAREDLPMSRRLLEAGADPNGRPPWRDIPRFIRLRIPYEVSELLTTDRFRKYTKRRSALQLAVERGDLPMIMLLLENGAELNGPPARVGGATAIQIACMKGYIDITKLLIERGADVNGAGAEYSGRTALEGAAEHGRLDTVFLLLESGCLVHGSFRRQYIRAVGFARAQAYHTVAKELQDYGDWTDDDEGVLSSIDLRDIRPESRNLEEELQDDEDVSEVDSEDLESRKSDPLPQEMWSESEFEDYLSAADEEDATTSGQSTPKGILDECGSSERGTEPQAVRLDTWDDLLEYYGDDEGV